MFKDFELKYKDFEHKFKDAEHKFKDFELNFSDSFGGFKWQGSVSKTTKKLRFAWFVGKNK